MGKLHPYGQTSPQWANFTPMGKLVLFFVGFFPEIAHFTSPRIRGTLAGIDYKYLEKVICIQDGNLEPTYTI
jgi:hypothetical protein